MHLESHIWKMQKAAMQSLTTVRKHYMMLMIMQGPLWTVIVLQRAAYMDVVVIRIREGHGRGCG